MIWTILLAVLFIWVTIGKRAVLKTMVLSNVSWWEELIILHAWPLYWKYRYTHYPPDDSDNEI